MEEKCHLNTALAKHVSEQDHKYGKEENKIILLPKESGRALNNFESLDLYLSIKILPLTLMNECKS